MKINITVDTGSFADVVSKLKKNKKKMWLYSAQRFHDLCQDYVPFQQGTLQNTATVEADENGGSVTWIQPYAHYLYYGQVMGPNTLTDDGWKSFHAPKHYTGQALTYSGGPMRGKEWDKRMLADKRAEWEQDIKAYVTEVLK